MNSSIKSIEIERQYIWISFVKILKNLKLKKKQKETLKMQNIRNSIPKCLIMMLLFNKLLLLYYYYFIKETIYHFTYKSLTIIVQVLS